MPIVRIHSEFPQPKCGCSSWLEHWAKSHPLEDHSCSIPGCLNSSEKASIVMLSNTETRVAIPLCEDHREEEGFFVVSAAAPVADVESTISCSRMSSSGAGLANS